MPFILRLKHFPIIPWLLITALAWIAPGAAQAADPSAIWKIDSEKCVPHMRDSHDPAPCSIVDLSVGYVVLKDMTGATQFLLMPTARISGIESPAVLAPDAPNYWDRAWRARALTEDRAGTALPREALSLAVNSPYGRSQDQLHIHIDCVRRDVRDALAANRDAIVRSWTAFPVQLVGQSWRAFRVDGQNLGTANPFRLLAKGDPDAGADMGKHTLVVVGMTWSGDVAGFAVLDGKVDPAAGNRGSGEDLQDHACALAH
jgi:CDP-diacylglycerol pyrophosphatase